MLAHLLALAAVAVTTQADSTYAFVGVSVIPMDRDHILADQTVVVRDDRIVAVGPAGTVDIPTNSVRIDGSGKYLMPGLAEMHAHIPGSIAAAEEVLFLYAAAGVTTIRGMLGRPLHLELRQQVATHQVLGPRIWTSSPSINGNTVPTPAAADSAVRASKEAGYDFLKIHPGPSRESFDQLVETAAALDITFSGHVPADVGIFRAIEAQYATIDHLDQYIEGLVSDDPPSANLQGGFFGASIAMQADERRIIELARMTKEAGVWNVPTQTLAVSYVTTESVESMARRPELRYIPLRTRKLWVQWKDDAVNSGPDAGTMARYLELRNKLIKALHDVGAGLLLGSDAPQVWNVPGFSVWRKLQAIVDAGLTPFEALETGTVNVGRFFGVENDLGTVSVGRKADLILLNQNPLAGVENVGIPAGVMLDGQWLSGEEIRTRLETIAAKYEN